MLNDEIKRQTQLKMTKKLPKSTRVKLLDL